MRKTPPNSQKMGLKSEKIDYFQFFPIFTKGIRAKLNELESESDTLAQNGLESAKFLIPVPHYNFCIVQCNNLLVHTMLVCNLDF